MPVRIFFIKESILFSGVKSLNKEILFLISYLLRRILLLWVFSVKTKSTSDRTLIPLILKSSKFPIGVATKYNDPCELMINPPKKIALYLSLIMVFHSCATTDNDELREFNFNFDSNQITKKIFDELKTISIKRDIEIIQSTNSQKEEIFKKGFLAAFYFNNKFSKNNKRVHFIDVKEKIKVCRNPSRSRPITLILESSLNENLLEKCDFTKSNTFVVKLDESTSFTGYKEITLSHSFFEDLRVINILKTNKFLLISLEINAIEKFINFAKQNNLEIQEKNLFLLEKTNDFESIVAQIFEQNRSEIRKRNVESILNRDLEFSTRKRKDLEAIILISSSEAAKRILPALKFNLLQDIDVFNMPNHFDSWNESSSPSDLENSQGLEYPILVNKMNFDDDSFNFLNSKEKVIYSLGFDAFGVVNKRNHFGFLGQHSIENEKVKIKPIKVRFLRGEIFQDF